MITDLKKIINEWAFRTHSGKPNPNSMAHQIILEGVLKDFGWNVKQREELFSSDSFRMNEKRKPGEVWKTSSGWAGLKPGEERAQYGMANKKTAQKYVAGEEEVDDKAKEKSSSSADSEREKIGGKVYSEPLETDDKKFAEQNKNNRTTDVFEMPESVKNNPKIPKKYTQFIERVMNTRLTDKAKGFNADGDTKLSTYYGMGKVGAGGAQANAGELLSMMGTCMRAKERGEFFRNIDEHIQKAKARGEKINITDRWSKAAKENSSAILRMMYDTHGSEYQIVGSAWDIPEEFEALGQDYGKKGYSTDIMFTVKVGDEIIKEEISLKQSLKGQRLLNKTVGSVFQDSGILPKNLQQKGENQYKEAQVKNIENFYERNSDNVSEFLNNIGDDEDFDNTLLKVAQDMDPKNKDKTIAEFESFIKQYYEDLKDNPDLKLDRDYIKQNIKKGGKRAIDKISVTLGRIMNEYGDPLGGEFVDQQKQLAKDQAKEVAEFIREDEKAKSLVMNVIRESFPLKSVSEGDENIILGEFVVSKKVMGAIFGTDDWNKIIESLEVNADADPPMVEYRAKVKGTDRIIPITEVGIREDGEGYGGAHKFEMLVAPNFGKNVESVSRDIYGDQEPIKFPDSPAADFRR